MKTIFTTLLALSALVLSHSTAKAQCIGPDLKFANPTLVSGTALSEGALYKFSNITPGIDCFIKLVKLNGGATLVSMETPGKGYGDAWQPIIDGPGTPTGNKSWIDWNISFKTTAGTNYAFPCLDITAIDVDGDNQTIGEFIQSDGHTSYTIPSPTLLTLTDLGNGRLEAQAPVTNRVGIDTMAMDVRIGFLYNGKDSVQLSLGSTVLNTTGGATQRLNCIYFKRMTLNNYSVLPVKYVSFKALAAPKQVELNWVADNEVNESYFEVQRSFDGNNFKSTGLIVPGLNNGINNSYKIVDKDATLSGKLIAYYRLKETDVSGIVTYSNVEMVKLQQTETKAALVYPNPFTDHLTIRFSANQNSNAAVTIQCLTGQMATAKNVNISKGQNTLPLNGMSNLPKGIYIVQIVVNGQKISHQKITKI